MRRSARVSRRLVSAPEGPIALVLRAYLPAPSLVDATYAPPPIEERAP
jgi:hypothetical protein